MMSRVRLWYRALGALALLVVLTSCAGNGSPRLYKIGRLLMGTYVQITLVGDGEKQRAAAQAVVDEFRRVENLASFHKRSTLTTLNKEAALGESKPNAELFNLILLSLDFAKGTGGAFDPTVGPLSLLWNFSGDEPRVPTEDLVRQALKKVGWEKVQFDKKHGTIRLPEKGMSLDLGGIAKGYALDRAAAVLKERAISAALVNAGGDIVAIGEKSPGSPWQVGIQDPRNPNGIVAVVPLKDRVIVTSGDYERFVIKDGKRYHHLLDPQTGFPAELLRSVTIIAETGVTADALATAVFVLGPEKGMKLVEDTPGVEALLIDASGAYKMSSGASQLIQLR